MRDLAIIVLEPSSASRPHGLTDSRPVAVFEGETEGVTRRWIAAETDRADADDVLAALRDAMPADAVRVALTAQGLEFESRPDWSPERVTHVMPVAIAAPASAVDDVDRWYREEHTEMLLRCPDWLRVRRYAIASIEGASWSRLALHELASPDVLQSAEVRTAMGTPWRQRLAEQPWFLTEGRTPLAVVR